MNQAILSAGILAMIAAPAAANSLAGVFQFTGQIRGQANLVEAQTAAIFDHLPRGRILADDIYDELEDLCRELDRMEADLGRSHVSRGLIRRLERRAEEIDEQACELNEAIDEAIRDANRRSSHRVRRVYPVPHVQPNFTVVPGSSRGFSFSFGTGRMRFSVGVPTNRAYVTNQAFIGRSVGFGPRVGDACIPPAAAEALCAEGQRLRLMTKQLLALFCN